MKKDLKTKLEELTHQDLLRWIVLIFAFGFVILVAVFVSYLFQFSKSGLSNDPEIWGQFGDFVGGTANPILGFFSLTALILTITLQSKQLSVSSHELELSRRELELTRDELRRSAIAQELSEKALRAQVEVAERSARLSGINFLLDHYKNELSEMRGRAYMFGDPRLKQLQDLEERERVLLKMLDEVFSEMIESQEKKIG